MILDQPAAKSLRPASASAASPELSLVVPTYNERDNIRPLVELLDAALAGVAFELILVDDDSPDGTADFARGLARTDPRIRVIQRIGRRGLSTAVIEGMLAAGAPYLAVIDADMQHDETLLAEMLRELRGGSLDIVVGSRYAAGGGVGEWSKDRERMSAFATRAARMIMNSDVADPMSGFFMITREAFMRSVRRLSGEGYKILLDLFASSPAPLRFKELPYQFRNRRFGESKVDAAVVWEYGLLLIDKTFGRFVPPRLVLFCIVGGTGVLVHFAVFSALFLGAGLAFPVAQFIGTIVAMTTNYIFNNIVTYRDRQKTGWGFAKGLLAFYAICGIGVAGNVGVASLMYSSAFTWWFSALAGVAIGTLWNYSASSGLIWNRK